MEEDTVVADVQLLRSQIQNLRSQNAPYEELAVLRQQLLKTTPLSGKEVKEWYADALKAEETGLEYGLLYTVFYEQLSPDYKGLWFYELCVKYYLDWLIKGPPEDFEDCELFQEEDVETLLDDCSRSCSHDYLNLHRVLDLQLRFKWYQSGYSIKGLVDEERPVKESTQPHDQLIEEIKNIFHGHLSQPHQRLDDTFAKFSRFVSANIPEQYDAMMPQASGTYNKTKRAQEKLELVFLKTPTTTDEWITLMDAAWAALPKKQRNISLITSVFESALEHESTEELWIKLLLIHYDNQTPTLTSTFTRFQRFHPDSFQAYIEAFHHASQIDMPHFVEGAQTLLSNTQSPHWEDLVVAYISAHTSTNTPLDLTPLLNTALERDSSVFHSVERFIASTYELQGDIHKARKTHERLTKKYPSESEGWLISYNFELRQGDYDRAAKVLTAAINRAESLDWPERIFEEAGRFRSLHPDLVAYQLLRVKIEKKKREVEEARGAVEIEAVAQMQELEINEHKRKAEDDDDEGEEEVKKKEHTRDREHLTVAVRNLPLDIQEKTLRQFFKDCGDIREIKLITLEASVQANIEFTEEKHVLRALTKDYKHLMGQEIRVQRLQQNTLFVTNFPPTYTQDQLHQLFSTVGPVASIRLPSLKFNTQRRFAYVEYTSSSNAQAAIGLLNGKDINGFTLSIQVSDPSAKQRRSGATEEGREVFVSKLDFYKVDANKVRQLFGNYGEVESVHLPLSEQNRAMKKKHDGYGFVVFSTASQAQEAVLALNMVSFEGRVIQVSISEKKSTRAKKQEGRALKDYLNSENAVGLSGVPDTVSASQLKELFSQVGPVEDVVLEPSHSGAIVVFKDGQTAGNASLQLEGKKLGDYTVHIVTVKDLAKVQDQPKSTQLQPALVPTSMRRRRMAQPLGVPKTVTPKQTTTSQTETAKPAPQPSQGRSNADFRAMFLNK